MTSEYEKKFNTRNQTLLDQSVDQLDNDTVNQLRRQRQRALHPNSSSAAHGSSHWPAMTASAAVMVITLGVWWYPTSNDMTPPTDDLQLIATSDELELYQDLEFYEWLEHEQQI